MSAVLGIKEIHVINANRVEKTYWQSKALEQKTIDQQFYLGCQQACDTVFPNIFFYRSFKSFMINDVSSVLDKSLDFMADLKGKPRKAFPSQKDLVLAIGPEGGFIDYELDLFKEKGFKSLSFTDRVLNVETAVSSFVSRMCY